MLVDLKTSYFKRSLDEKVSTRGLEPGSPDPESKVLTSGPSSLIPSWNSKLI